jgi:excisionase family DNA binding protein
MASTDTTSTTIPSTARVLTKQQVADMLQLDLRTISRMDAANQIPGRIQLGRSVRFSRDAIDTWIVAGSK